METASTVHLPVGTGSVPVVRGLLLVQALVDRLDLRRDPDGRRRVTLEQRLAPCPPLRPADAG